MKDPNSLFFIGLVVGLAVGYGVAHVRNRSKGVAPKPGGSTRGTKLK